LDTLAAGHRFLPEQSLIRPQNILPDNTRCLKSSEEPEKEGIMAYSEKNIAGIFHNRAEKYQYETCIRYKKDGRYVPISWKEMQSMVTRAGLGLISLGVEPADMVGIFSENCWQWLVADLAALSIGATDAPIYATNSAAEASYWTGYSR
jgi:long-subunit acyl-CoA synthetase (AMP-forming)